MLNYNVIRTLYADERIKDKLEYIRRQFHGCQAHEHLLNELEAVEQELSYNATFNRPHIDNDGEIYRYAHINVGEGYYLLYRIEDDTVIILDCLHKRELYEIP
ncbi:MAG: type II toxin-antitoxin system RelE/ParE family toxin [Lachnospiraceae bacterium]|nr:type II toxin-antitoxin system RelE/ParE family toxin [Lachnospiraceae bacterium]